MKSKLILFSSALMCWFFTSCTNTSDNNNNTNLSDNVHDTTNMMDNRTESTNPDGTVSHEGAEFMRDAAKASMMEIETGKLALTNSSNADIKSFGQMMIDDHTKANNELKALAAQKGVMLPTDMTDDQKDHYNKLNELKGNDFDKKYADMMEDDHEKDVDMFADKAKSITDTDLLTWIKNTLPVLQKHLDNAKMLDNKYNK